MKVVNDAASEIGEQEIRRSIENFSIRTQKCYQNKGGHFEAELKWIFQFLLEENEKS